MPMMAITTNSSTNVNALRQHLPPKFVVVHASGSREKRVGKSRGTTRLYDNPRRVPIQLHWAIRRFLTRNPNNTLKSAIVAVLSLYFGADRT